MYIAQAYFDSLSNRARDLQQYESCTPTENERRLPSHPNASEFSKNWTQDSRFSAEACSATQAWRASLVEPVGCLPLKYQKEVFDIFFSQDLYGRYKDSDTIFLSRGAVDSSYLRPPLAVAAAVVGSVVESHFGYSDSIGHIDTRGAVAIYESRRRGEVCLSGEIAITPGAGLALSNVLRACSDARKTKLRVAFALPNYAPFVDSVLKNADIVIISAEKDLSLSFERILSFIEESKPDAIILNLPGNPVALKGTRDQINYFLDRAAHLGIWIIVEEVGPYDPYLERNLKTSRYSNIIIIHSFSKEYHIPGLKLSYIRAQPSLISKIYRIASSEYGSPPSTTYLATTVCALLSAESMEDAPDYVKNILSNELLLKEYYLWQEMENLAEVWAASWLDRCLESTGGEWSRSDTRTTGAINYFLLPSNTSNSTYKIFVDILQRRNVSVFPSDCFAQQSGGSRFIRLTRGQHPRQWMLGVLNVIECLRESSEK